MIKQLSQETIEEYGVNALEKDEPLGSDYSQGVSVGRTVVAKWWNWLFNAVTKRLIQSKADAQYMLTELQNVITDAGITLDETDNKQLIKAVEHKAQQQLNAYIAYRQGYGNIFTQSEFKGLESWSPVLSGYSIKIEKYGGNFYMGVSSGAKGLFVSTDYENWTEVKPFGESLSYPTTSICKFKGVYYIAARNSDTRAAEVYASVNGRDNWSMVHSYNSWSFDSNRLFLNANDTKLILSLGSGRANYWVTTDGTSWSALKTFKNASGTSATAYPKNFNEVLSDGTNLVYDNAKSTDGEIWTELTESVIGYSKGMWFSDTGKYSYDLTTWNVVSGLNLAENNKLKIFGTIGAYLVFVYVNNASTLDAFITDNGTACHPLSYYLATHMSFCHNKYLSKAAASTFETTNTYLITDNPVGEWTENRLSLVGYSVSDVTPVSQTLLGGNLSGKVMVLNCKVNGVSNSYISKDGGITWIAAEERYGNSRSRPFVYNESCADADDKDNATFVTVSGEYKYVLKTVDYTVASADNAGTLILG